MYIAHLKLINFRNYHHLDLELPARKIVIEGDNAQGKTNLLEAIFFLATTRSHRASNERELIGWGGGDEFFPGAQLTARVHKADGEIQLEIILRAERAATQTRNFNRQPASGGAEDYFPSGVASVRKLLRLNGLPRRAADVVGQMNVVMFSAPDIELVAGAPALRRRYLDITLSQLDNRYLRSLQRYQRVIVQRNHLLRRLGEGLAQPQELAFWDKEVVEHGSYITLRRHELISALNSLAQEIHLGLTSGYERLEIKYLPNVARGGSGVLADLSALSAADPTLALSQAFHQDLAKARGREIAQGISLVGPHRDDLQFLVNRVDMGVYGSRGQQRAIIQSLKLAEAQLIVDKTDESPVLLLDDVLSELDRQRQEKLLQAIASYSQVIVTTTEPENIPRDFVNQSARFHVREGAIYPVEI